jgi:hypothetical protein
MGGLFYWQGNYLRTIGGTLKSRICAKRGVVFLDPEISAPHL